MMTFYDVWAEMIDKGIDDSSAIEAFLNSSPESVKPFRETNTQAHESAFNLLDSIPIERFLNVIAGIDIPRTLIPADVPCFSTFDNGAARLNELLEFEPSGLTFSDAGYQLMNSVKIGARTKYGENHSKLAAIMDLVTISDDKPVIVRATPWGSFLTRYDLKKKHDVLQKLILRDLCVKTIVKSALNGPASYRDTTTALSASTALRRRANVKCLVEYVLTGTENEDALSRIDWEV